MKVLTPDDRYSAGSALPVAAAVPASVARPEPAVVRRVGQPVRPILPAWWRTQGNMKEKATNSLLEISQLILLRRGRRVTTYGSTRSAIIGWQSHRHCELRTAELLVDTPDGRIDTRFPRLHFPRLGKLLHSILLRWVHCKDTVCARTFSSLDSPLQFHPFEFRSTRSDY